MSYPNTRLFCLSRLLKLWSYLVPLLFAPHCVTLAKARIDGEDELAKISKLKLPRKNTLSVVYNYTPGEQTRIIHSGNTNEAEPAPSPQISLAAKKSMLSAISQNAELNHIQLHNEQISGEKKKEGNARPSNEATMQIFYSQRDVSSSDGGVAWFIYTYSLGLIPTSAAESTVETEIEIVYQNEVIGQAKYRTMVTGLRMPYWNPLLWIGKLFYNDWDVELETSRNKIMHDAMYKFSQMEINAGEVPDQQTYANFYKIHAIMQSSITLFISPQNGGLISGKTVYFVNAAGEKCGSGIVKAVYHTKAIVQHQSGYVSRDMRAAVL